MRHKCNYCGADVPDGKYLKENCRINHYCCERHKNRAERLRYGARKKRTMPLNLTETDIEYLEKEEK